MKSIQFAIDEENSEFVHLKIQDDGNCIVRQGLIRLVCPCCSQSDCFRSCDGSQGADELMESETDYRYRITYNIFVSGVEALMVELFLNAGLFNVNRDSVIECIKKVLNSYNG